VNNFGGTTANVMDPHIFAYKYVIYSQYA